MDVKDALRTIQSLSVALLIATATVTVIGLSPDTAERSALAADALDSLPAYPTARDTSANAVAREFAARVARVDSILLTLNPIQVNSRPLFLLMHHHFSSMSTSAELAAVGARIEMAPDGNVPSRVRFLESLREVAQLAAPNMDSLAAYVDARLDSLKAPTDSMTLDLALDPSDSTGAWMESGRVRVKALLYVDPDTSRYISAAVSGRRDSFVVSVPTNLPYLAALQSLSWRMMWYFEQQRWLTNRQRKTSVRWSEFRRYIFLPLSPAALSPVDRIKPVMLELADTELPAARKFLRERAEALRERGIVTILGLTLENSLAAVIVPLVFASLALLLLFHLLHALNFERSDVRAASWAPMFAGWTGIVSSSLFLIVYPAVAAWLFAHRMQHVERGPLAIAILVVGVAANVGSFMAVRFLRRLQPTLEEPAVAASSEGQIKLYALLVDQLTKYNAIFWQAPALAAVNVVAIDKLKDASPWIAVALAVFNGAMIYAFSRMIVRQSEITDASVKAQRVLEEDYPEFIPEFSRSGMSSRTMLVSAMVVLDAGLLIYGLVRVYAKQPVWAVVCGLVVSVTIVVVAVRQRALNAPLRPTSRGGAR